MSELVDAFMEHYPVSPVGTTIKPAQLTAVQKEVRSLRTQLAKANERVKELELIIVAITHADETGYVDDVGFIEGWSEVCDETKQLLNKFAIENKIEFKNDLIKHLRNNYTWTHSVYEFIDSFGEQLRKEQAGE